MNFVWCVCISYGMYIDSGILLVLLEFLDISWFVLKFFCNYVMY